MKSMSYVVAFTLAICGLVLTPSAVSATAADISGTWEVTIHYPAPDGDYRATYVLKQDGERITGTYHGMHGPAEVTGTIKSTDVTLTVTVQSLTAVTARFSGKVTSATKMSGTVTGTSSRGTETWSGEKRTEPNAGALQQKPESTRSTPQSTQPEVDPKAVSEEARRSAREFWRKLPSDKARALERELDQLETRARRGESVDTDLSKLRAGYPELFRHTATLQSARWITAASPGTTQACTGILFVGRNGRTRCIGQLATAK